jgi:hypothetical protein
VEWKRLRVVRQRCGDEVADQKGNMSRVQRYNGPGRLRGRLCEVIRRLPGHMVLAQFGADESWVVRGDRLHPVVDSPRCLECGNVAYLRGGLCGDCRREKALATTAENSPLEVTR